MLKMKIPGAYPGNNSEPQYEDYNSFTAIIITLLKPLSSLLLSSDDSA
jgi:hypothetical protein